MAGALSRWWDHRRAEFFQYGWLGSSISPNGPVPIVSSADAQAERQAEPSSVAARV